MPLESVTYISDLVATNPLGTGDPKSQGDDHLRAIKLGILNTFPGITGAVTATHTELNYVDGVTSAIQTQMDLKAPAASPTFTGEVTQSGGTPKYIFNETDQGADGKRWSIRASSGLLRFATQTDLGVDTVNFLNFTRSGTSLTAASLTATAITLTGTVAMSSTLAVTGAVTLTSTLAWGGGAAIGSSGNVPLLSSANSFTTDQKITTSGANPRWWLDDGTIAFSMQIDSTNDWGQLGVSGAYPVRIFTNNTHRFEINGSGNYNFMAGTVTVANSTASEVGFNGTPINSQAGNYTTVASDGGRTILSTTTGGHTISIDNVHPLGTILTVAHYGAGGTTIAITSASQALYLAGANFSDTKPYDLASGGVATLVKVDANHWIISGNIS